MSREKTELEKRLTDLRWRYIERFGNKELIPLMQVDPEVTYTENQIKLYERCLAEGKPVREYITIYHEHFPDDFY